MGPVSLVLAAASLVVVYLARGADDRAVPILAWGLFGSLLLSLAIHTAFRPLGRTTPLMLLDGVALYATGLMAICRFDRPRWLYALCAAFVLQCLSHLAYVCFLLSSNAHILSLNVLFALELLALVAGARKTRSRPRARRIAFTDRVRPSLLFQGD